MEEKKADQQVTESDGDNFSEADVQKLLDTAYSHFSNILKLNLEQKITFYKSYKKRMQPPYDQISSIDMLIEPMMPFLFADDVPKGMIFLPEAYEQLYLYAQKIAKSDKTILIQGETGTGKTPLAEFIHMHSDCKEKRLITLNAALYSEKEKLQGVLFGIKGGIYQQIIKDLPGLISVADKSSLFIDDIDELDLPLQGALLSVLDTGEYRMVGGTEILPADCRWIFGTNSDLKDMIEKNTFKHDLYWRIQQVTMETVPFRKMPKSAFFEEYCRLHPNVNISQNYKDIKYAAQDRTNNFKLWEEYDWPGNFREFESYVEEALDKGNWAGYFPQASSDTPPPASSKPPFLTISEPVNQWEMRRRYAKALLASSDGKANAAARIAVCSESTFNGWLNNKKLISPQNY